MSSLTSRRGATRTKPRRSKVWKAQPQGWYVEGSDCTRALLTVEAFEGECWDPACGRGDIVVALREAGLQAYGTDLVVRVPPETEWFGRALDFLGDAPPYFRPENVVTNPPFFSGEGAEAFIRRGLEVATRKVAVFVDQRFCSSLKRADGLFAEHPPAREWKVVPRPSCPPGDFLERGGKAEGGTANYSWLVWDKAEPAESTWRTGFARRPRP